MHPEFQIRFFLPENVGLLTPPRTTHPARRWPAPAPSAEELLQAVRPSPGESAVAKRPTNPASPTKTVEIALIFWTPVLSMSFSLSPLISASSPPYQAQRLRGREKVLQHFCTSLFIKTFILRLIYGIYEIVEEWKNVLSIIKEQQYYRNLNKRVKFHIFFIQFTLSIVKFAKVCGT